MLTHNSLRAFARTKPITSHLSTDMAATVFEPSTSSSHLHTTLVAAFSSFITSADDALAFTALALTPPTNLKKKCASAARKLGTSQANVDSTIESLSYLLNTASKHAISTDELGAVLASMGCRAECASTIKQAFEEHTKGTTIPEPRRFVRWRLDVPVASRASPSPSAHEPSYLVQLDDFSQEVLQCDVPTMLAMADSIESALRLSRAPTTRRVVRAMNLRQ
ncbi:hypothetical protein PPROV_000204800 [Pycnococcus provasolii]|uniref:COMM domain-containing protein n=1 Tax=Pycnococcus provasolii TaxID=41880 RepID=A0A830HA39_9CHLO|nr:hypothetical protein PPROV_000204800 [Pycnococcus provasolii]